MSNYVRAIGPPVLSVVVALALGFSELGAQERFLSGQTVMPVFEGWEKNSDGTYNLWFGYLNRNWEQRLTLPIGRENNIQPGGADRGQPSFFQTRRQQFVFKVVLPADWPKDKDVVWTLTTNGTELKAFGSLWPVWEIDEGVISANRNATGGVVREANTPPTITSAPPNQTVAPDTPVTLTMQVIDDGNPKPRPRRRTAPSIEELLRVTWVQYRGPGTVRFDPDVVKVIDGKATTSATFDKPGTYMLRAYAEDAGIFVTHDVTFTVTGGSSKTK